MGPLRCADENAAVRFTVIARPALDAEGALALVAPRISAAPSGELRCAGIPVPLARLFEPLLPPILDGLAKAVAWPRLPLGPLLRWGLDEAATPQAVEVDGTRGCLDLAPSAWVLAPIGAAGVRLGLEVAPRLELAPCPPRRAAPAGEVVVREVALGERFTVEVALTVALDEAERRLALEVVGRAFDGVIVRRVQLADAEGRVLVRAEVGGRLRGTLYLWGTPTGVVRDGRARVEVPDLRLAVETRDLLARIAIAFLHERLTEKVRRALSFDITDALARARRALPQRRALGDHATLALAPDAVELATITTAPGRLVARARVSGRATLDLR
jgi:hypothetical protein